MGASLWRYTGKGQLSWRSHLGKHSSYWFKLLSEGKYLWCGRIPNDRTDANIRPSNGGLCTQLGRGKWSVKGIFSILRSRKNFMAQGHRVKEVGKDWLSHLPGFCTITLYNYSWKYKHCWGWLTSIVPAGRAVRANQSNSTTCQCEEQI